MPVKLKPQPQLYLKTSGGLSEFGELLSKVLNLIWVLAPLPRRESPASNQKVCPDPVEAY